MSVLLYIVAGLFLPLFPMSMLFNIVYTRLRNPYLRGALILAWPQIGLAIIVHAGLVVPHWLLGWALLTSLLYAVRALALREVGLWTSFVATSAWALLWIMLDHGLAAQLLRYYGLGISIPLALMALLGAGLERRFGAAYLGLYGGLADVIPRFSTILVIVVLAIIATPLFPTFFAMLAMINMSVTSMPFLALGIVVIWMLWSWAGAKLIQGLIVGPQQTAAVDLNHVLLWLNIVILIALAIAGIYLLGGVA